MTASAKARGASCGKLWPTPPTETVRVRPLAAFSGEVVLVAPRILGLGCQRLPIGFAIPIRQPLTAAIPLQRSGQSTMMFAVRAPSQNLRCCAMRRSPATITIPTRRDFSFHWTMVLVGSGVVSDTIVQ